MAQETSQVGHEAGTRRADPVGRMVERIRRYREELEARGDVAEVVDPESDDALPNDSHLAPKHGDLLAEALRLEGDRLSEDLERREG
jgi:hypothetical protein